MTGRRHLRVVRDLDGPAATLRGIDPRLVDLVEHLSATTLGGGLTEAVLTVARPSPLDEVDVVPHLRAVQWFLDRAADGGIPLTGAGYLKPADVLEASTFVPVMADWIGKKNRENTCRPLLEFRKALQQVGLLRKNKDMLLLTRAGEAAQRDPGVLWEHLADRLIPSSTAFKVHAALLLLAYTAASADRELPFATITALLNNFGWRHEDGSPVVEVDVRWLPMWDILQNITDQPVTFRRYDVVSPAAAALARRALRRATG